MISGQRRRKTSAGAGRCRFLKVGHHGSRYSTCQEFLDVVKPELAVVSCSATNTYGHPSGETIERLEDSGAKIWYTMKEGAVTAETDGKEVWWIRLCIREQRYGIEKKSKSSILNR